MPDEAAGEYAYHEWEMKHVEIYESNIFHEILNSVFKISLESISFVLLAMQKLIIA